MPRLSPNDLSKLLDGWITAGLDPAPVAAHVHLAQVHLDRLRVEYREYKNPANRSEVVRQLADGEVGLLDAVRLEHLTGQAGNEQKERALQLYRDAQDAVLRTARTALLEISEGLVADVLGPAHENIVEQVVKLGPLVAGISTDEEAITAAPKVRDAWGKLHDLTTRRSALLAVHGSLSAGGFLRPLPPKVGAEYRRLARPHLKPSMMAKLHRIQQLVVLVDAGAGPGIYTDEQAEAYAAEAPTGDLVPPAPSAIDRFLAALS